ncbi:hypothetical protein GCM10011371_20550 [Novosphingobium marinum]|uniref:TolA-binding protein n=1 Tax=Novosphingobium marinum TaxID=1514948 RepID=A0A7Y9XX42_9SPHN|nr:tetratricopeptide repeat protein [Novosphingobium marinum]NYH96167.1 TolA-binding protein [Novosphingobium marinum]GGC33012.1 hypothetical protein GCM10011371_20550 [Novosphingobium marinum]
MTRPNGRRSFRSATLALAALAVAGTGVPVQAQSGDEARIRKLEAEVRALQRKVFPGADGRFFEPEITAQSSGGNTPPASTSAVTDILTRMDALEAQMARLTGQVEENTNRIAQMETRLGPATPVAAPASVAAGTEAATTAAATPTPAAAPPPAAQSNLDAMSGGASAAARPAPAAATPSSGRVEAVSAVARPSTDDPADDSYSYGFRLWEAGFYPEAQQQLKIFVDKYPDHWRASWGRNLLGRAYLDAGDAREAAKWFLQNYQADKRAGRAPDSLLYLAVSMKRLGDTNRACIALAEFSESYAAEAAGRLQGLYDATRSGLDCSG